MVFTSEFGHTARPFCERTNYHCKHDTLVNPVHRRYYFSMDTLWICDGTDEGFVCVSLTYESYELYQLGMLFLLSLLIFEKCEA